MGGCTTAARVQTDTHDAEANGGEPIFDVLCFYALRDSRGITRAGPQPDGQPAETPCLLVG